MQQGFHPYILGRSEVKAADSRESREGRTEGEQSRHDRWRRETEGGREGRKGEQIIGTIYRGTSEGDMIGREPGLLGTSSPLLSSPLVPTNYVVLSIFYQGWLFQDLSLRPIAECSVLALAGGLIIAGGGLITVHDN